MTAAEQSAEFQNSLFESESENSNPTATDKTLDNIYDITASIDSKLTNEKISDSKDSILPETDFTEIPGTMPNLLSDQNLKEGTSLDPNDDGWLDIMGSGDFKKKVIKPGSGVDTRPNRGDQVIVNVSYYVNNILIEEKKDLRFIVGDLDVVQGLDLAICLMEKEEIAKVIIPSKLAYGTVGLSPNVPPDSPIECDIELKDIVPIDENSLNVSDRLKLGDEKRSRGNFFYERAQYIDAIHCYERAAEYLDGVRDGSDSSPEELQEIVNMRLKVYNNMAASHLKLSAYSAALKSVDAVLKMQPKNVKALFRKGKILGTKGSTDEAITCMKMAASLEPETKVIQAELIKLRNRKKKEEQNQKAMYQRMFKTEPKQPSSSFSSFRKWSMISCGVLAVAVGSAMAYRQLHT